MAALRCLLLVLLLTSAACLRPERDALDAATPTAVRLAPLAGADPTEPSVPRPPAPTGAPGTLLLASLDPARLVVPEGETAYFTIVLASSEREPIAVEGLPATVTLLAADGEAIRTFPGAPGAATIAPGGAYRQQIAWNLLRDDGSPARPGRYRVRLSAVAVHHPGGTTSLSLSLVGDPVVEISA